MRILFLVIFLFAFNQNAHAISVENLREKCLIFDKYKPNLTDAPTKEFFSLMQCNTYMLAWVEMGQTYCGMINIEANRNDVSDENLRYLRKINEVYKYGFVITKDQLIEEFL